MNDAGVERKTTRLRRLVEQPGLLVMPGAFDPIGARLIEEAGFNAVQVTGLGVAATYLGLPDYSILGMSDMVAATGRIAAAVDLPVMGDGDTGFGNAVNAWFTVQAFEKAGAAGMNLEDQVMPKRCGHLDGKQILPLEEAVTKIRAAAAARQDKDFVINARTDTLATDGLEEVLRRGNAYLEAGATMIFVEGATSLSVIQALVAGIKGPVGVNIVEGGKTGSDIDLAQLEKLGVARVSLPGLLVGAAWQAMTEVLAEVKQTGSARAVSHRMYPFNEAQRLVGMPVVTALESRFLAPLKHEASR